MNENVAPNSVSRAAEEIIRLLREFQVPTDMNASAESSAKKEVANAGRLMLDSRNMTSGMKAQCGLFLGKKYDAWQSLSARFRDAVAPFSGSLAKFEAIDKEIEKTEGAIQNAEQIVLRQWHHGEAYRQAKADCEAADEAYLKFRDRERQREPRVVSWFGTLVTLLLIGAVEWLINFEAFSATFGVPALAVGFTIAVALAVAVASHWHGIFFKQREFYFGDGVPGPTKTWNLLWLLFVTTALVGALIFVGWNRYIWAMEIVAKTTSSTAPIIVDADPIKVDVIQKVLMSLLGNIIVWVVGTALVYLMHDTNPDFADAFVRRKKARKIYLGYKSKIDDQTKAFVVRHENEVRALESQQRSEEDRDPRTGQIAKWCAEVRKLNTKIEASFEDALRNCVEQYRFALFQEEKSKSVQFFKEGSPLTIDEYLSVPLLIKLDDVLSRTG